MAARTPQAKQPRTTRRTPKRYTHREYADMKQAILSPIDLGGATQRQLDALAREYEQLTALFGRLM